MRKPARKNNKVLCGAGLLRHNKEFDPITLNTLHLTTNT